jgi:CBS domain-containing protein/anti-sigma regulatory factor (Ser/Thr protein kinase)
MSEKDKFKYTKIQELTYELKISEAMTTNLIIANPETTMYELRGLLKEHRISGLPVVENGNLIGIISIEDLINCLMAKEMDKNVGSKMTKNVKTVFSDEPLVHAISIFNETHFGRLPVIERDTGKLVGMITKGDIIRCLLKKLEIDYHEEEIHKYRASHIFEDLLADEMEVKFSFFVKGGDFKRAGECSSRLRTNLLRLGIEPEKVRRLAISSYEAEMNMVIFTDGGKITVNVFSNKIIVEAQDRGPGIPDVEKALTPGYSTAPDWVRNLGFGAGMGLPNIKNLSDEMEIKTKVGEYTHIKFGVNL